MQGEIVVTCLDVLVPYILPYLASFQSAHPGMTCHMVSSDRKLKLEYGEADMAFRLGLKPSHPDNVVLDAGTIAIGLFATQDYIDAHGMPDLGGGWTGHRFVGADASAPTTPYLEWQRDTVPKSAIGFRTNSVLAMWEAVRAGLGIGFHPTGTAEDAGLVSVHAPEPDWHETIWAVTHMDLHRTAKVQALVRILKANRRSS